MLQVRLAARQTMVDVLTSKWFQVSETALRRVYSFWICFEFKTARMYLALLYHHSRDSARIRQMASLRLPQSRLHAAAATDSDTDTSLPFPDHGPPVGAGE